MDNRLIDNLEKLKKMLVLLSEERRVVLSHRKTFEHVEKMRSIVNESIEMVNKSWQIKNINALTLMYQII